MEEKEAWTEEKLLKARSHHLGPSLSLSYSPSPLWIVRGSGQYLYDQQGTRYIDCVNNVAHVGHCHPRVAEAAAEQLQTLNTNTRYLHPLIVEYAQALSSTFPPPLSVCFFVCSGSEANDLALRLARTYTKRKDVIVLDAAYHGHLTSLVEISPYKFEGKGGFAQPDHVHKVSLPDLYRGQYRAEDPRAGTKYAAEVKRVIERAEARERGIAAFFAESILGCGGQVCLPDGYLAEAYQYARDHGAVCIADEVQVGFGRVGSHFWAFETQGVVPDIVTLGKPIGNGYPMAAVVTTPEIASAFCNGMEYFNTFGGSTTAMAVGLAVLSVIKEEKLQENAKRVGDYFLRRLLSLQRSHHLIGDVRGRGLFLGIELAAAIVNRMKERSKVLLSTDGPQHNVIKIKPPLCLTERDVDDVIEGLDEALTALYPQQAKGNT